MTCQAREGAGARHVPADCTEDQLATSPSSGTPASRRSSPPREPVPRPATIVTVARAPLPEQARWLGSVPLAVVAVSRCTAAGPGALVRMASAAFPEGFAPRAQAGYRAASVAPPPSFLRWRVEGERTPQLPVSPAGAVPGEKTRPLARHLGTAWRVVRDEGSSAPVRCFEGRRPRCPSRCQARLDCTI